MYGFYVSFKLIVISRLHFESVLRFCNCNSCNAKFARKTLGTSQYYVFFLSGFLSRPFTNHRTTGKGGGHVFNFSPPVPPASRTLSHISWAIAAESSPLRIGSGRTQTGNLWFPGSDR